MTRKDYQAVAAVLRAVTLTPKQREELVERLADAFEADNERFSRARFWQAVNAGSER